MGRAWYSEGLRFACNRCGLCCRGEPGYVWVTLAEARDIAAELGVTLTAFEDMYLRKIGRRLSLRERSDGDCVFYKDGCSIYRVRPLQCVTYPFWAEHVSSPGAWERLKSQCPGAGVGRLFSAAEVEGLVRETDRARAASAAVNAPDGRASTFSQER